MAIAALGFMSRNTKAISLKSTGVTVEFNEIPYYIPPFSIGSLPIDLPSPDIESINGFVPMTVISSTVDFAQLTQNFSATDDVFNTGFLQGTFALLMAMGSRYFHLRIFCS